jgi:hypothetical protein
MKKLFLVLDTETASLHGDVFDVGYTIADKLGNVYHRETALVREVFQNRNKMRKAFYYNKVFSDYIPMLERGDIRLRSWQDIVQTLRDDCARFNVQCLAAYNVAFDLRVMKATQAEHGDGGPILGRTTVLDLWLWACQLKLTTKTYRAWCNATGAVSEAGNYRSNAESVYRYISGDDGFIEDHTALSDAEIETDIMAACFRRKQAIPYNRIVANPWRLIQTP